MYFLLIRQPPSRLHITEIPYYFSGALDAWQRRIRHWFPPYFAGKTSPASGWCLRAFLWQYIPKHQINELLIWMSVPAITLFRKEAERVKHRFFLFDFLGFWRHMAIWREAAMLERGRRARDPGPRPRRERGERPGGGGGRGEATTRRRVLKVPWNGTRFSATVPFPLMLLEDVGPEQISKAQFP